VNTPFKDVTSGSASISSDVDSIYVQNVVTFDVRYPIDIRRGSSSTVDIKKSNAAVIINDIAESDRGFRITKTTTGDMFINYQVESEL
jgi:hypothetical protein